MAKRLQLSVSYVWKMAREGEIPHLRYGRSLRFRSEAIDEWLRASERANLDGSK